MLACKSESMQLSALKARITALGAIGPPNIVDLPEFAPVFPTTALFGWAFRCFERLECLERCAAANWNKLERVSNYRVGISP